MRSSASRLVADQSAPKNHTISDSGVYEDGIDGCGCRAPRRSPPLITPDDYLRGPKVTEAASEESRLHLLALLRIQRSVRSPVISAINNPSRDFYLRDICGERRGAGQSDRRSTPGLRRRYSRRNRLMRGRHLTLDINEINGAM